MTFPMNQDAQVTGIKAMSDDDRGKHLKAIDAHRKSIDRAQRGIREHLKAMFDGFDDDNDLDLAGDPALLEGGDDSYGNVNAGVGAQEFGRASRGARGAGALRRAWCAVMARDRASPWGPL